MMRGMITASCSRNMVRFVHTLRNHRIYVIGFKKALFIKMKHSILECVNLIYFLTLTKKKLKIYLVKNKFNLKNL
jgi:hypothetical protein